MEDRQFREVYDTYARPLYNYALWMTGNRQASDDILQRVFIKAWRLSPVPEHPAQLRAWLYTVCRNSCLDHFRRAARSVRFRARYAREHASYTPPHTGEKGVWDMLLALEESERAVIEEALRHHEGQMAATARSLKLERSYLYKKCKALGLRSAKAE